MYKHNYQEWHDGKVILETCHYELKYGERVDVCNLDDFKEFDRYKIKEAQKEFFENSSIELLDNWKNEFNKRFSNSCDPELFLQDEIFFFEYVIFYDKNLILVDSYNFLRLEHKGKSLFFENLDFWFIRNFIDYNIVGGNEISYDFVHSPNFKFIKNAIPNEVYGKALWDYYKWLKEKKEPKEQREKERLTKIFRDNLIKHGFLALEKVSILSKESQSKLIENLFSSKIPYCIAMFGHLNFFEHLYPNCFKYYGLMDDEIYTWFKNRDSIVIVEIDNKGKRGKGSKVGDLGRDIRGERVSLNSKKERKSRYTAYKYIDQVEIDYNNLK